MVGELTWSRRLVGLWLPLTLLFVFALFPFAWMAATSLKANAELYDPTANPLWIRHPSLVHYIDLFKETNFVVWIGNTMLVATVSTVISLLLGVMLAYPLARMRFPAAGLLAITVAVTYLVPQTLLFVPMADLINRMKLGDTLSAVMLTYPTLLVPFCAWLLIGYFKTVPKELEDAGRARPLVLHGAGGGTGDVVVDEERVDDRHGDRAEQRPRHQLAPVKDVAADELGHHPDRYRAHLALGQEDQRVQEFVLGQREGEDPGRQEPGRAQRQHDPGHGLEAAGAVDACRLLELARDALEVAHEQPRRERNQQRRVRQHDRGQRVAELQPIDDVRHRDEQQRLGDEIRRRDTDGDDGRARKPEPREPVGDHRGDHDGGQCGHHRHQHRVVRPRQEIRLVEQVDVVLECRLVDDERHDLGTVELTVGLDRRDQHPVEGKQHGDQQQRQRQVQRSRPR